jgi:hypothetical protein
VLNLADGSDDVSATKLRGFFGNLFVDDVEFHHHSEQSYHYPLVQYKKVNGRLMVLGFQNYSNVLVNKLSSVDLIKTQRANYSISNKEIFLETFEIENVDCVYDFVSPWLPLNEENYAVFQELTDVEQKVFLERILVGNVLSCLKGLGIFVTYRVISRLFYYQPVPVRAHGNSFQGFRARFGLNVSLPDFTGLGKSVSKGFGSIRRE